MSDRVALIFGVSGQDGSYLAEFLRGKGYRVVGTSRDRLATARKLQNLGIAGVELTELDLRDGEAVRDVVAEADPNEIYNFAAFATGTGMFDEPAAMAELNGRAVLHILDAMAPAGREARFCQASSAEMFRLTDIVPQDEATPLAPGSPYGEAKVFAHNAIRAARDAHDRFACSAILFNHESPRRPSDFVSRKITRAAAEISLGLANGVALGDLEARRDWSHARDIVRGMWLMLQQEAPDDYVLASGHTHSVAELCEIAFSRVGLDWTRYVTVDPQYLRHGEGTQLIGRPCRAREILGWQPEVEFSDMIAEMVDADLEALTLKVDSGVKTK